MNATLQAQQAYAPARPTIQPPRAIEAHIITDITARLSRETANYPALVSAVHDNRRMWTTLAVDVADANNGLPAPLRAQIFYLAEFTEHHSKRFLRGEVDLTALIDINTAILRGLKSRGRV